MATLRDIRGRIIAVRKTQKITRAMKMVASAKFARAARAIQAARPYARKLAEVLGSVASGVDPDAHPLIQPRPVRKLDLILFTSDRGLCGAYNTNIARFAERLAARRRPELERINVLAVGRKGGEAARRRKIGEVVRQWQGIAASTELAHEVAHYASGRFEQGECDEVVLVYSEFQSALTQTPTSHALLPLRPERVADAAELAPYEIEPDAEGLLAELVPRAVDFAIFRALLENQAGEQGARMTAMENATNNTQELIRSLTLQFNKARQAAITAELVEIVGGAQAL